jgi:hypothetical protein
MWHEVYPVYSTDFNLTWWDPMDPLWDNCNGVLDPCDHIELKNMTSGLADMYHITDMAYDLILNEYITDPVGTRWHELWPDCTVNEYDIVDWSNNTDWLLSPCDNISLALYPTGETHEYHVENVTLTLNVTVLDVSGPGPHVPQERLYLEYIPIGPMNWSSWWPLLYHPKIEPWDTDWQIVCPDIYWQEPFFIWNWIDNCNGVLDSCDDLWLDGLLQDLIVHVDELAVDITVKKITEEPPPPMWYKKPPYPDYAPSGMPDIDQKQDVWGPAPGWFTWCGPTAVANSLWWFDSKYDPSDILTAYAGVPDDHHVLNVDPFIRDLAFLMDTDDQRFPNDGHTGTYWYDMVSGIDDYLEQQGVNDTLEVHWMEDPDFIWIEDEIMLCQDVVLLLEFWVETAPGVWEKADPYDYPGGDGGHYVTCAGVNSTTFSLLIADPYFDAAEQGWAGEVLPLHGPHGDPTVHNDTQYVSHDAYNVIWPMAAPGPWWELVNGTGHGYLQQNMPATPPNVHTFITVAIATSPLEAEDVAVTNVTTIKDGCPPLPTVGRGYNAEVNVTVENQGTGPVAFSVYAYANMTSNSNVTLIGTAGVFGLPAGNNVTIPFDWNTTTFAYGNYTVFANCSILPTEVDIVDNKYVGGWVYVTGPADIDGSGQVGPFDWAILSTSYGSTPTRPGSIGPWNPNADIDNSKQVGPFDWAVLSSSFGDNYSYPP